MRNRFFLMTALSHLQVNFGIVTSTEVAYFSYIYSLIPLENYQRATSYLRSAMLTGYTFGASLGQMLVSLGGIHFKRCKYRFYKPPMEWAVNLTCLHNKYEHNKVQEMLHWTVIQKLCKHLLISLSFTGLDYFYLNVLTLGIVCIAFLVSFLLPMPKKTMFFKGEEAVGSLSQKEGSPRTNRYNDSEMDKDGESLVEEKNEHVDSPGWCSRKNVTTAGHLLWKSFKESYSSRCVCHTLPCKIICPP